MHDEHELPDTCAAEYVTRGNDPYGTECDLAPGHSGPHLGANPFGGEGRVEWSGGRIGCRRPTSAPQRPVDPIGQPGVTRPRA
jgi:hypothetical protein